MAVFTFPVTLHFTASLEGEIADECRNTIGCDLRDVLADPLASTATTDNGATITLKSFEVGEAEGAAPDAPQPVKPVCSLCASDQIVLEASILWNVEKQVFEAGVPYDKSGTCGACGTGDMRPDWVPAVEAPESEEA